MAANCVIDNCAIWIKHKTVYDIILNVISEMVAISRGSLG